MKITKQEFIKRLKKMSTKELQELHDMMFEDRMTRILNGEGATEITISLEFMIGDIQDELFERGEFDDENNY